MKKIFPILLVLVFFVASCGKEENQGEQKSKNFDVAKIYLQEGNYNLANQYFEKILAQEPDNGEALIGSAVSQFLALTIDIANYIASVSGINRSEGIPSGGFDIMDEGNRTEKEDILEVVKKVISGFLVRWEKMDKTIDLAKAKGTSLNVETLPVYWNFKEIMDLGGEWDRSDIYFLSTISKLLLSFVKFALSQELDLDIYKIYAQYVHMTHLSTIENIRDTKARALLVIMNILTYILNDPEQYFLKLSKWDLDKNGVDDGVEFYTYPISGIVDAYSDLMKGLILGLQKPIDKKRIFLVIDKNNFSELQKLAGDEEKDLNLFGVGVTYEVILYNRGISDDKRFTIPLFIDVDGLNAMKRIADHIKSGEPSLVYLRGDIVPVLSDVAASILKIIDYILPEEKIKNSSLLQKLALVKNFVSPGVVAGFLETYIPDVIAFNFNHFFNNPVNIRDIIPAWRSNGDKDENMFYLEWEWPAEYGSPVPGILSQYPLNGPYGFVLPYGINPEDQDHFVNRIDTEYQQLGISRITKDTIASPLPYIAFRNNDASFNGLFYLDFGRDPEGIDGNLDLTEYYGTSNYPTNFSPATARDFNTVIAYIYKAFSLGKVLYK